MLVAGGLQLMLLGLFKKVVIADRLAEFVDPGFANPALQSPVTVLIAVYFYAFQIYCDFSGYSDIASGQRAVLGIRLMENFRRPYFAASVPEFWGRRWHISLIDVVPRLPLYPARRQPRRKAALVPQPDDGLPRQRSLARGQLDVRRLGCAQWRLPGRLLHDGASAGREPQAAGRAVGGPVLLLTFHLILFSWMFFRADSLSKAWTMISRIFASPSQIPDC